MVSAIHTSRSMTFPVASSSGNMTSCVASANRVRKTKSTATAGVGWAISSALLQGPSELGGGRPCCLAASFAERWDRQRLEHEGVERVAVFHEGVDEGRGGGFERLAEVGSLGNGAGLTPLKLAQPVEEAVLDGGEESESVTEPGVQRPVGCAGASHDGVDRQGLESSFGNEGLGGVEHPPRRFDAALLLWLLLHSG